MRATITWRRTKEKLPKEDGDYLILTQSGEHGHMNVYQFREGSRPYWWHYGHGVIEPQFWAKLPKRPSLNIPANRKPR